MNLDAMARPALLRHQSDSGEYLGLGDKFSDFLIVSAQPFTQRNLDRFGATWLLNHAKKIHLVDLSLIIWGKAAVEADQHDAIDGVLRPRSWGDIELLLDQYKQEGLLIPYVTAQEAMPLLRMMIKYSPRTLFYDSGSRSPESRRVFKLIASRLLGVISDPRRLFQNARRRLALAELVIDYHVLTGKDSEIRPHHCAQKAKVTISSHSYDYVSWKTTTPFAQSEPYIVFLDQAYPDHPDFVRLLGVNPFARESYYSEIDRFLGHISDTFGMPVLIALHPRSSDTEPRPYQRFQTFRDRTASLVKGAQLVVAHDSTAVSFAVLGRKPLLLVEVDQRSKRLHIGNVTRNMSDILAAPVVHISSRALPPLKKFNVDESKYASYEALYVRHPGCNGVPIWDRVFGTSPDRSSA